MLNKDGELVPDTITDAKINITYNYRSFYYKYLNREKGIRWLYDKTGETVLPKLKELFVRLMFLAANWNDEHITDEIIQNNYKIAVEASKYFQSGINIIRKWVNFENKLTDEYEIKINDYWKVCTGNAAKPILTMINWIEQDNTGIFKGD